MSDQNPATTNEISWELPDDLEYFRSSEAWRVELSSFNGPMDLLLYLIHKDEIDIYDIPISYITNKYLEYIDVIKALSLETAGEFIVMAATLARIKVRMLLPIKAGPDEIDEEDPRAELVRRLLEYKRFKDAASDFNKLEAERGKLHVRTHRYPFMKEEAEPPKLRLNMFELLSALSGIIERVTSTTGHTVNNAVFTVSQKIELLQEKLSNGESVRFDELFKNDSIKMEVVVTFVAILELSKQSKINIMQTETNGPIWLKWIPEINEGVLEMSNEE
ncbi:segregation/condensation protein A [bacterium]|nr:segregation/condensation protein A [bacterium]MBT4292344.1 segregation/condensation protein A [bacterium]MBT7310725.1 segregation/condensation protein A [bacterium]